MKENESDIFDRIYKILLPKDYIVFKLTGKYATDFSDASGTLYFDVENSKWSKEMLDIIGIEEDKLPKVYSSNEYISNIKKEISDEFNLNENVKVIIGGADQAVAAVGNMLESEGDALISLGTSGVVYVNTKEYFADVKGRVHSFKNAIGGYLLMGCTLSAAASLKWWVENIQDEDFDKIINEAQTAKFDEKLIFTPYLTGERTPYNDSDLRASFTSLDINHKRKDLTRAVLEGVAFSLKDSFDLMYDIDVNIKNIYVNGGGAKSEFWCQILSNVIGRDIYAYKVDQGPAFGAAILGLQEDKDLDFEEIVKSKSGFKKYLYNKEENLKYNKKHLLYKKVYDFYKNLYS